MINSGRINNMAKGETSSRSICNQVVLFDCHQLSQALLDFNLIPVPLATYMVDNTMVTNANKAPNDKLTNMEIMIMVIIAPMNAAIAFNFYLLAATEYTLLVSVVLRVECKGMCRYCL